MKRFVIGAIFALFPGFASAEGYYVGALYGSTSIDSGVDAVVGATLDEDDTGFAFVIGNEVDATVAVEGFYINFGEASLSGDNGDTFSIGGTAYQFTSTATIESSATSMGVAGKLKFDMAEKLQGYVKGGFHWWESELTVAVATTSASTTADGTDLLFGFGAEYDIGEKVAFIAGYDKYNLDDEDVTFVHGGIKLSF